MMKRCEYRRCGGIGRRARLKIWYGQPCVGSSPTSGTTKHRFPEIQGSDVFLLTNYSTQQFKPLSGFPIPRRDRSIFLLKNLLPLAPSGCASSLTGNRET